MKIVFTCVVIITLFALTENNKLVGKWQTRPAPDGTVSSVVFGSDNTYEAFINNTKYVKGVYTLMDSIFTMEDNGCGEIIGAYKVIFSNDNDSVYFKVVDDECFGRMEKVTAATLGRVKK